MLTIFTAALGLGLLFNAGLFLCTSSKTDGK